jgi:hypothetical protein
MTPYSGATCATIVSMTTHVGHIGLIAERPLWSYGMRRIAFESGATMAASLRPADRIAHTHTDGTRREGTVVRVYTANAARCFDVLWDEPEAGNPAPWRGASHGLAVAIFDDAAWTVVRTQLRSGDWCNARKMLFSFGQLVATPGALDMLDDAQAHAWVYLLRHVTGDWGDVDPEDIRANEDAVRSGARVFSSYTIREHHRLWIITEADRAATTLLLPSEY